MPPKSRNAAGAKKVRRKEKKNVAAGEAHRSEEHTSELQSH
mgnify:CR=1 FL=1